MAKLEIEFELTGLKFKINGERDDVSGALAVLQQQVAALAHSAAAAAGAADGRQTEGGVVLNGQPSLASQPEGSVTSRPALESGRRSNRRKTGSIGGSKAEAIQFTHDPDRYGFPKQDWSTADKAMWLLYILDAEADIKEASAPQLAATFNFRFREFKSIRPQNITRDLGSKKKDSLVNNDPSKDPETWHLLSSGKTAMQNLAQRPNSGESQATE